jgi:predicted aspartyl protease
MGKIIVRTMVQNAIDLEKSIAFDGLIDTGATCVTLPRAWRKQLGMTSTSEEVKMHTATQETVKGELCGPVRITIEGFRPVHSEVLFVDMLPDENNRFEALVGHIPLQQAGIAIDMITHRLIQLKYFDLK